MITQYHVLHRRLLTEWANVRMAAAKAEEAYKVARLVALLPETVQAVEADLEEFGRFLDAASRADG